ncbi:hypothetical protein OS493_031047 [Desmophyllum pertusum]|uniref:Uncharacterized protein n=1 Tax=Desmophyllum pertusum TaxID=174260 RepID=A0A9X0CNV4_9CNID|nr:hypothetical protein OS493_031047 [Desmophyllum pertusum]
MENGFMISGFQLQKEWSECVVEACLREAFEDKIPLGVDFEILMPVHSTLIKLTLAPGQSLNGVMVHRVFEEKPIYIRPFQEICDVSSCSIKRYRETSPDQEDDFIRHTKTLPWYQSRFDESAVNRHEDLEVYTEWNLVFECFS